MSVGVKMQKIISVFRKLTFKKVIKLKKVLPNLLFLP